MTPPADPTQTRLDVLSAHEVLYSALVGPRTDLLDEILDTGFIAVHVTGHVSSKAEWIQQITSGQFTYHAITEISTHIRHSDEGVNTVSTAEHTVTINGQPGCYRLRSSLDWAYIDGRWRAVRGVAVLI